jgi:hypothetical protein
VFVVRVRRRFAGLVAVLVVGGVMFGVVSGASAIPTTPCGGGTLTLSGSTATCSYASGASDTFSVPAGVTSVTITAVGGHGGSTGPSPCPSGAGGEGATVSATATVNPSDSLAVTVATNGGNGTTSSGECAAGGAGGSGAGSGGAGADGGGGGGGGSAVIDTTASSATLVAAGGGGGGGAECTSGCSSQGGDAGQQGGGDGGGFPGTQGGPGQAGGDLVEGADCDTASPGSGMNGGPDLSDGGGGGGGYYGGGAGCNGSGGGGGSSYPAGGVTGDDSTGTPSVTISYTVPLATPSISTTQQPASATVGTSIADQATVTGLADPSAADTVTFNLYSSATTQTSSTLLSTNTQTLSISGSTGTATSAGYTATATGTDYWVATYNGDSNNSAVTSGTAAEPVVIKAATPTINTSQQPASATVGSSIADKATVSGGYGPTGTVTFDLYSNSTASGSPLFSDTESLSSGTATSKGYTATATGTDYWVATYNGDSNNSAVTSGTAAEPVVIKAATSLTAAPQIDLRAPRLSVGLGRVSATLTSAGSPVGPGELVTFTVGATTLCTANTNTSGVATCNLSLKNELRVLFANSYTATFTANGSYLGSTATTQAIVF